MSIMRRASVLDRAPGSGVPNMTPMVDVTLVILIFFMASATIAGPEWFLRASLPSETPNTGLGLPSPVVRVELSVSAGLTRCDGLGGSKSIEEAIGAVNALDESVARGLSVLLSASDDTPYADVVRLHGVLRACGVEVRLE